MSNSMAAEGGSEGSRRCERSERPPGVRALVSSTLEGSRSVAGLRHKLPFVVKPPRPLQGRSPFANTEPVVARSAHTTGYPPYRLRRRKRAPAGRRRSSARYSAQNVQTQIAAYGGDSGALASRRLAGGRPRPPGAGAFGVRRAFVSRCLVSASIAHHGETPQGQPAGTPALLTAARQKWLSVVALSGIQRNTSRTTANRQPAGPARSLRGRKHIGLGAAARAQGYANQRWRPCRPRTRPRRRGSGCGPCRRGRRPRRGLRWPGRVI